MGLQGNRTSGGKTTQPAPSSNNIKKDGRKNGVASPPPPRPPQNPPPKPKGRPPITVAPDETDLSWHEPFLAFLSKYPHVGEACKALKVPRWLAYKHKSTYEDFAARWADAIKNGVAAVEERAYELALGGNPTMVIFMLKNLKPETYAEKTTNFHGGVPGKPIESKVDLSTIPSEDLRELKRLIEQAQHRTGQ